MAERDRLRQHLEYARTYLSDSILFKAGVSPLPVQAAIYHLSKRLFVCEEIGDV